MFENKFITLELQRPHETLRSPEIQRFPSFPHQVYFSFLDVSHNVQAHTDE